MHFLLHHSKWQSPGILPIKCGATLQVVNSILFAITLGSIGWKCCILECGGLTRVFHSSEDHTCFLVLIHQVSFMSSHFHDDFHNFICKKDSCFVEYLAVISNKIIYTNLYKSIVMCDSMITCGKYSSWFLKT